MPYKFKSTLLFTGIVRWLYGKISREQAEELLHPRDDGLYLVRESTSYPGDYTLCVCYEGQVEHYRVICKDSQLTIDSEEYFTNLKQLIEVCGHFPCLIRVYLNMICRRHLYLSLPQQRHSNKQSQLIISCAIYIC